MNHIQLRRIALGEVPWNDLDRLPDRTVFQTRAWLSFLQKSQSAEPVVATVLSEGTVVGWFTGAIVRRFGLKFLGSPLRGWATSHMGFNMCQDVSPQIALPALRHFALHELGCIHCEVMDRRFSPTDGTPNGFIAGGFGGYQIDLRRSPDEILANMNQSRRRAIRLGQAKNGVTVERAHGLDFADEHYAQLRDVFVKQSLPPPFSVERVRQLILNLEPTGNLLLVRARDPEGRSIATGIFPGFNQVAYFWMGASLRSGQKLLPNEAVQWFAICYWRDRGVSFYDMGGGGDYKARYGGDRIEFGWLRASRFGGMELVRSNLLLLRKKLRKWQGGRIREFTA